MATVPISPPPATPRARAVLAVLGATFAFGYGFFALIMLPQVQPATRAALDLSRDALARIHGATFVAAALGGFVFGRLADRGGRRAALAASVVLPALGLLLAAEARGVATLAAARLLTGFGVGGGWGVAHAAVADAVPPARRALAAGCVQAAAPLGNVAAALLGLRLGADFDWRDALRAAAAPGLLVLAAPWIAPAIPERPVADRPSLRRVWSVARRGPARVLVALLALHMGAFWMFYAWIPEWLGADAARPPAFVVDVQFSLCAGFLLGDLTFASVARRLGLKRAFVFASIWFAAGIAAVAVLVGDVAAATPLLRTGLALAGLGAGLWAGFGPFFALHVAADVRGVTAATGYQFARASQLVLQPLVPWLRDAGGGFAAVFGVAALLAAAGGLGALLLPAARVGDDPPTAEEASPGAG